MRSGVNTHIIYRINTVGPRPSSLEEQGHGKKVPHCWPQAEDHLINQFLVEPSMDGKLRLSSEKGVGRTGLILRLCAS